MGKTIVAERYNGDGNLRSTGLSDDMTTGVAEEGRLEIYGYACSDIMMQPVIR